MCTWLCSSVASLACSVSRVSGSWWYRQLLASFLLASLYLDWRKHQLLANIYTTHTHICVRSRSEKWARKCVGAEISLVRMSVSRRTQKRAFVCCDRTVNVQESNTWLSEKCNSENLSDSTQQQKSQSFIGVEFTDSHRSYNDRRPNETHRYLEDIWRFLWFEQYNHFKTLSWRNLTCCVFKELSMTYIDVKRPWIVLTLTVAARQESPDFNQLKQQINK